MGRGDAVRVVRVLQGARGRVRGADLPVAVAEDALPGAPVAGLLTHDPGMYPRRLILEDARQHGIPILPLDVNASEPEYVVEVRTSTAAALRLGDPARPLQDVHGISDAEIRSIMQARADRAFRDVGDFLRRTAVSRPVTEALAHAGAFDRSLERSREPPRHLYAAMTTEAEREGDQLTLADAAPTRGAPVQGLLRRRGRAGGARGARASTPPGTS